MGAEIEETEPEDRMVGMPRKSWRCSLGLHRLREDGICAREGCDYMSDYLRGGGALVRDPVGLSRLITGGVSGEHEARERLLLAPWARTGT